MLKKSLRAQIVSIFIVIVLISVFISFFIGTLLSQREVAIDQPVLNIARDVSSLLDLTEPDRREQVAAILSRYNVHIESIQEGDQLPFSLTEEEAAPLFASEDQEPLLLSRGEGPVAIIGVPSLGNEQDSLLVKVDFTGFLHIMQRILIGGLSSVIIIGSLLILLASRYIVGPVKKLTNAAKEVAKGNLSFRLHHKKKNEFGDLMDSFNQMAVELQKIDKMRDDFVTSVSHEIQSPITSIRGFTRAIRDGVIPVESQKEYLDIIYQETLRLSKLSDHLLRLASLDSDHHPFHPVDYPLDEQLRRIVLVSEPLWMEKNLDVELDLFPCSVTADRDLFEQVWQNLLTNAIKFSNENNQIIVQMERSEQEVLVHIKDNGKGILKEDLPYIFDRLYMADQARGRSGEGNGLGLSIVKKIIELHNCKIDVTSAEGKGTCMTVTIPVKTASLN
ncbi:ATP-binding protein [Jeotgalibacillus proteolyticus]|uniref:HAMP domain-containing sensor histidine kinase n=1 Tax=Jeotgalibacillus proteolyticus TaxID=2082395 RepID=UPI003CED6A49